MRVSSLQVPLRKRLGVYLVLVSVLQFTLYVLAQWRGESGMWLFYLDPRLGWFFLETIVRGSESFPGVLSWVTAIVLLGVGIGLVRERLQLRTYLLIEGVMTVPTLLMFVWVIIVNLGPGHGFSVGELPIPFAVLLGASIVPWCVAWVNVDANH